MPQQELVLMKDRNDTSISDLKVFARFEAVGAVLCTVVVMMPPLHMYTIPWHIVFAWAFGIGLGISAYRHGGPVIAHIGGSFAVFLILLLGAITATSLDWSR